MKQKQIKKMTITAMLGAVSSVLMMISVNVPLMPSFIKLDVSELPALLAAFAIGPFSGITVCFIKNVVNLFFTTTGGVGELSNFLLGVAFVFPAGFIYQRIKTKKGAILGASVGAVMMALLSVPFNYFLVYPVYTVFLPMEAIIEMYQLINPNVNGLLEALVVFNMPFTFIKGMINLVITVLIYKKISPLLR